MKSILFITRGRGWGHAIRDMAIIDSFSQESETIRIGIISSESGYQAYRIYGCECTEIPTGGEEWKWFLEVEEYLEDWGAPSLIVSDEHFGGLIIAQELKVPSVFITDWFPVGEYDCPELIADFDRAETIIYPGYQSSTPVPEQLSGKAHLVGPIVRSNPFLNVPRLQLKRELGLMADIPLILLMGGGSPENQSYISTCIHAVENLEEELQLVAIAGKLKKDFPQQISSRVIVLNHTTEIVKYMAASETVITQAGHTTLSELAVYAIPSITVLLPTKLNPMQEIHARAFEQWGYTHVISVDDFSQDTVGQLLKHLLVSQESERRHLKSLHKSDKKPGKQVAKEIILSYL
ncbi:MAG: glycosyltransferase [Candidatus Poribacteria bacterium]